VSGVVLLDKVRSELESLRLRHITEILERTLEEAAQNDLPALEVLEGLLSHEITQRWTLRVDTAKKMSGLPREKTLEGFDFSFQPGLDRSKILELAALRFLAHKENVIFLGPPGVGKSHLAAGLGLKAVEQGQQVLFINAHELILKLKSWSASGALLRQWGFFRRLQLLIIDEMGYLPIDADGSSLLFQLIARRYEQGSTIVTSNLSFGQWGSFLGNDVVASAILDRLLHHGSIINLRGESYRLKDKRRAGLIGSARISETPKADSAGIPQAQPDRDRSL
jgi:DNA replication protein DnaC